MLDIESSALIDLLQSEFSQSRPGLPEQLKEIVEEHERTGKPVIEIITNYGIFTKPEILSAMADNLGSYVWNPVEADLGKDAIDLMDVSTARSYGAIPLEERDGMVHLAMRNPLDYQAVEALRFIVGHDILPVVVDPDIFDHAIEKYYPEKVDSVADIVAEMGGMAEAEAEDARSDEDKANDAPIVRFVDAILGQAIKLKASDIHFEPFEKNFQIRYRVDGAMYEMPPPPKSLAMPVISRVKILSGLNISERRRPQDGRIQLKIGGRPIDLRVSCLPTSYGESVVLRILDRSVVNLDLEALGMGNDVLEKLREIIRLPNGILLVTGPTGSGKTTTLYSSLKEVNSPADKLLTAEDPVEYDLEGIMQVPINDAVGMTFHKALRAFLRQDPDKIMVGEIRDFETAQIAIEAALTGHFVFSTLHTNDAAGTVTRLVDMGVEPFLICSSLAGVLSQRLVRRVCRNCKVVYDPTDEDLERMRVDRAQVGNRKFVYGKGCPACNNTGYKGRKALCELLVVTNPIRELIYANAPMTHIREKARELGMRTIREDGILAIMNQESSVDEVMRYT